MTESDYLKILEHLEAASRVLRDRSDASCDGHVLQLLNLSIRETRRQLAGWRQMQAQQAGTNSGDLKEA